MRLIDANAMAVAIKFVAKQMVCGSDWLHGYSEGLNGAARAIEDAPTIDAVLVVRCKDCDYYREDGSICANPKCGKSWHGCRVPEQHYCSYGERKDNA